MITRILLLCFLLLNTSLLAQSAWNQKEGRGYAQLSLGQIGSYDKLFSKDFDQIALSDGITEQQVQLYGEYGISEQITLILSIPLFRASIDSASASDSHTALGNIRLGSRFHLYSRGFELSVQIDIDTNTSDFDNTTGVSTGYDAWTLSPYVNLGKSFGRFYAQSFLGVNIRTDNYSHSFRLGLEVGFKVFDSFVVAGVIDVQQSFENGDVILPTNALKTGLFVNDQEYVSPGIKLIWDIQNNFGVTASLLSASSGNLVPKAVSTNFGFYAKF